MRRMSCLIVAIALLAAGCGGGSTEPPAPTAASRTAEGWAEFAAGRFSAADTLFVQALDLEAGYPHALTGRGWVSWKTGDVPSAETHFSLALAGDPALLDARSGRVLVSVADDRFARIISDGRTLVGLDPQYRFNHQPASDAPYRAVTVRWLVARAGLDIGDHAVVVEQLDVLSPNHGLDPSAVTFAERALALLESLRDSV